MEAAVSYTDTGVLRHTLEPAAIRVGAVDPKRNQS